ncbi:MAG TPA: serine/threonine-protein kinase [Planctomycetota bacterium]|nr:serine/threonine-protein kinase [Planctomycetota bacterium]
MKAPVPPAGGGRRDGPEDDDAEPRPVPAPIPGRAVPGPLSAPAHGPVPRQIAGYRIQGVIGRGSMGTVYKALQVSLDRVVAIKVLHPSLAGNPRYAKRFEREALASARLTHPHIVAALDVGDANGVKYLAMEFVPGRNVAQILAGGPVEERRAIGIVSQVARALEHAHRNEIVHRDIKPANILVTDAGTAKLGDLGLAKHLQGDPSQTDEGAPMGTPFYVSPEQARGDRRVDIRSDIYSLGATLFHMVTGRVPFPGPNPAVVMTKHLNEPVEPADEVNPRVTRATAQIIEKMMAKDRDLRYQSPAELLVDLQAWLEGRIVVQPKIELKARRRFRRYR